MSRWSALMLTGLLVATSVSACPICFRGMALKGEIPGVVKASW